MNEYIEKIRISSETLRQQIIHHPSYSKIKEIEGIRTFMEHHIYAVWDFMSLLKALQINLTSTSIPWFPVGNPDLRYLINEIVTGEESDVDQAGNRMSHFELYLEAMAQCGADTSSISNFLSQVRYGHTIDEAASQIDVPANALKFMKFTFDVIATGKPHVIAAVFTFGREDLIPHMFHTIVSDIHERFPDQVSIFKYYLDRHIEVDGDHHSSLALKMVSVLCGDDNEKWNEAEAYVLLALQSRIDLWDGVFEELSSDEPCALPS